MTIHPVTALRYRAPGPHLEDRAGAPRSEPWQDRKRHEPRGYAKICQDMFTHIYNYIRERETCSFHPDKSIDIWLGRTHHIWTLGWLIDSVSPCCRGKPRELTKRRCKAQQATSFHLNFQFYMLGPQQWCPPAWECVKLAPATCIHS